MPVLVEIAPDGMQAWALVTRAPGESLTASILSGELRRAGVVAGIDRAALTAACAEKATSPTRHLVASGTAPLDGADGRLDVVIRDPRKVAGTKRADGRMDFKDHGEFLAIEKDQLLARLVPAVPGQDGRDVRGKTIPARGGKPAALPAGDGTKVTGGGTELRAKRAGVLRSEPGKLSVEELVRVRGDLGYGMGNVDCRGSVVVTGDVRPGFRIRATGGVRIDGSVEAAEVTAGGSVVVGAGVLRGARICAGAEAQLGHVSESYVEAATDVRIEREARHGTINAGGSIVVVGRVVGGALRAKAAVTVGIAGRAGGERTELCAGVDPMADVRRARLVADVERLRSGAARLDHLEAMAPAGNRARIRQAREGHFVDLRRVEEELAALDAKSTPSAACFIRIERESNADVCLRIGPATLVLEARRGPGRFVWEPGTTRIVEVTT